MPHSPPSPPQQLKTFDVSHHSSNYDPPGGVPLVCATRRSATPPIPRGVNAQRRAGRVGDTYPPYQGSGEGVQPRYLQCPSSAALGTVE